MDGLSYHPYPNPSDFTVPFSFAYGWPNAGVQELGRIKQAVWDAFGGTAQSTTESGLKLYLDEVGWQVDTSGLTGYEGTENVAVTSEAAQATIYSELVRFVACDPDVAQANFFGYYDEGDRGGWQSALRHADGSERPSNAAVADAIAATGGRCQGTVDTWNPARQVIGASADFGSLSRPSVLTRRAWGFRATALEDATYRAGIFRAATAPSDQAGAHGDEGGGQDDRGHDQVPLPARDPVPVGPTRGWFTRLRSPPGGRVEPQPCLGLPVAAVPRRPACDQAEAQDGREQEPRPVADG